MKNNNKNNAVLSEQKYEEMSDIPENISQTILIDGEETIEEDSVVELDLKDFEEMGSVKLESFKTKTIIDELESVLSDFKPASINIEKITVQIDGLTSVKKSKKNKKEIKLPGQDRGESQYSPFKSEKIEKSKEIKEQGKAEKEQNETVLSELLSSIEEKISVKDKIESKISEISEEERNISIQLENLKYCLENISANIINITQDFTSQNLKITQKFMNRDSIFPSAAVKSESDIEQIQKIDSLETSEENRFFIEIPDKLLNDLPSTFNIDEFGKIDLNEAEIIAKEDIYSLAKNDILEEIEGLDFIDHEFENESGLEKKSGQSVKTRKSPEKNVTVKKIETENADKAATHAIEKEIIEEDQNAYKAVIEKPAVSEVHSNMVTDNIKQEEEINDKNVIIIENEDPNIKSTDKYFNQINETGKITTIMGNNIEGKARQLKEAENKSRKEVTGLIRDNYPAFKDLLKEKQLEEKRIYSDDDISFIDNFFLSKGTAKTKSMPTTVVESSKAKTHAPQEQIFGIIPDEFELFEDLMFSINNKKIGEAEKKPKFSEIPYETRTDKKFKYILPDPASLHHDERKSIEDDISSESALIYEEDVDKIKKKLEDSMKKKIGDTIQDISDKITIYEDNKKNGESTEKKSKNKEEIIKLLKYLNVLFENLPEESIKKFADSEYYELYKKILKDMDI